MRCGLLGKSLKHSYSPQIHAQLGNYPYDLFEIQPENLEDFLRNGDFIGLNVTIPYKKDAVPYCDVLSARAEKLGAVNTIVRRADGSLIGHNTDYYGFHSMLQRTSLQVCGKKVLVLGSGGASVTAVAVLEEMGADVYVISRTGEQNYNNIQQHADASVLVNTTPVGMYPNNGVSPVDLDLFPQLEGVLDVIYNPSRTKLILDAQAKGLITANGLWMLVAQAKESAEWFTGEQIDDNKIAQIHSALQRQMENIIFIGMPGCGKSTIAGKIANQLMRKFVDADAEIEKDAGMRIPEIFAKSGEAGFRALETEVLARLGKESGLVIATGGGCVTQERNYPLLHQNGLMIWLKRDIAKLPTDGRPLSQANKLETMYCERETLYHRFADIQISNDGDIDDTIVRILALEEDL